MSELGLKGFFRSYESTTLQWPSAYDRFKSIDNEIGYRTVYAGLCSQSHSDPEDIINELMALSSEDSKIVKESLDVEQYYFSLYILLQTLVYQSLATGHFLKYMGGSPEKAFVIADSLVELAMKAIEKKKKLIKSILSKEKGLE